MLRDNPQNRCLLQEPDTLNGSYACKQATPIGPLAKFVGIRGAPIGITVSSTAEQRWHEHPPLVFARQQMCHQLSPPSAPVTAVTPAGLASAVTPPDPPEPNDLTEANATCPDIQGGVPLKQRLRGARCSAAAGWRQGLSEHRHEAVWVDSWRVTLDMAGDGGRRVRPRRGRHVELCAGSEVRDLLIFRDGPGGVHYGSRGGGTVCTQRRLAPEGHRACSPCTAAR